MFLIYFWGIFLVRGRYIKKIKLKILFVIIFSIKFVVNQGRRKKMLT